MKTISLDTGKWLYLIFTLNSILFLTVFTDVGWAGCSLCLALAFSPFGETKWHDLKRGYKVLVLAQSFIGITLIILDFFDVIKG
ncbi:MAG: hypothetical protein MK078_05415 [Crocinitomicaceae bacterium]|nr:hypothetical protein [Crocinitomicaceae bacterium]